MADSSFTGFFNSAQPFGMNIKVPTKTLQQFGSTAGHVAGGVFEPLFTYLETNENVFSGDVVHELNRIRTESFNTELIMSAVDEKVNGPKPRFDTTF